MLKYFCSVILFIAFGMGSSYSQGKYAPKGIRVGGNLKTVAASLLSVYQDQYEVSGDITFHKYLLAADLGRASFTRVGSNFRYLTEGTYYRVGVEVNFIQDVPGNHALGLGLKYASSEFRNDLNWYRTSDLWGRELVNIEQEQIRARWFELAAVLKVNVVQNVQLGLAGKFKFAPSVWGASEELAVYEIPGYGPAEPTTLWGFDYYIYYFIPLFK